RRGPNPATWAQLNVHLLEQCRKRRQRTCADTSSPSTSGSRKTNRSKLPMPAALYQASDKTADAGDFPVAGAVSQQRLRGASGMGRSRAGGEGLRPGSGLGTISFDAVKHLLLGRIEHRPPRLDLAHYPYLPLPNVQAPL